MKVNAVKIKRNESKKVRHYEQYQASVPIADLVDESTIVVDVWDPKHIKSFDKQGYQRSINLRRARSIGQYILEKDLLVDFPTACLLSVRKSSDVTYNEKTSVLSIDAPIVYVVDGQHRIQGIRHAASKLTPEAKVAFEKQEVPVTIVVGLEKLGEVEQFKTINDKAKRVETGLANELLALRAYNDAEYMKELALSGEAWKAVGTNVIHELNSDPSSKWHKKIKMPNENQGTVSQGQFLVSLKNLICKDRTLDYKVYRPDGIKKVLDAYWAAVAELFPKAFLHPKDHLIQTTAGVFIMHGILPGLLTEISKEGAGYSKDVFVTKLTDLFTGYDGTRDDIGTTNENSLFWQKKNKNGVKKYGSSQSAFKYIQDEIVGEEG